MPPLARSDSRLGAVAASKRGGCILHRVGSWGLGEPSTLDEFRRRRAEGSGVFVIVGRPSGRVLVHHVTCPFMTDDAFSAKHFRREGRKGRYVWAPSAEVAVRTY